ncbi:DUF7346 family protein [Natrarchaeobaculum aegyptiacum]|uniref:Uncharacterized protein n=1 Tax=Natrarchaeobaculum aegyptiacum TaxID=745377 RepID=A0A2Z2HUB2_9EURY|nr:hypothetical protein [Natrarchaeobaculum aegyptiacum]ARS88614.1 hypothetical protein B1756_01800 [Natrarchaeobaculum aegyptiacum]
MQPVEDDTGNRYLLCKRSTDSSLVRDPVTGTERYIPNDRLETVDVEPLEAAAGAVPAPLRTLLTSVHDEPTLGLLFELEARGPLAVRTILGETTFCESDLNGRLSVLVAVGLLEEATVAGERGYGLTETGEAALETLREGIADNEHTGDPASRDS